MKRQHVNEAWNSFAKTVIPQDASAVQRREMRRSFYAGAGMLLGVLMTTMSGGSEPTDEDMATMNAIYEEINKFIEDVQAGHNQ